ncbi:MAG: hypothetical protein HRT45_00885 [Bdellovibrionales bacterium]|nr:hypothetical protein [Bdellovibrionales bacterium]
MMGVNDGNTENMIRANDIDTGRSWFEKLRMYRLVSTLLNDLFLDSQMVYYPTESSGSVETPLPNGLLRLRFTQDERLMVQDWLNKSFELPDNEKYQFFVDSLNALDEQERARILALTVNMFIQQHLTNKVILWLPWKLSSKLIFEHKQRYSGSLANYVFLCSQVDRPKYVLKALQVYSKEATPISNTALGRLSWFAARDKENEDEWSRALEPYNHNFKSLLITGLTSENFKRLSAALKLAKICHVAMAYPTQSADHLRDYFYDRSDLMPEAVVSQKLPFEAALQDYSKEDIFVDLFAGDFGHTTKLGHSIIKDQVVSALSKLPESCFNQY